MAKTVNARTLPVQSIGYKYGKLIIPPYEVDVEFTPQEEAALDSGITADMIPSAAGANNKLADEQYVNNAVSEYSAQFLGTSAQNLTEEQFLAWANTLSADNNDYCYWWTLDSDSKTIYKRYKYNGTEWLFEYNVADPSSVPTALSQLADDANHRLVTDTEKSTWNGKANASEMSVTDGTGTDADKTTIQLKSGTSATVLKSHQDISGKANKSEMSVSSSGDKTTITLKEGTSAEVLRAHQDISGKADKDEMSITNGTGNATIQLKSETSVTVLTQHQDISGKADIGTASDAKTVNSLYGAKAYSKDLVDTSEYNLRNLSAILAFATGTGTVTLSTSPEWKLILLDYADKILLGKRRDDTWCFPEDLDDLLDQVIADYGN